MIFQRFEPLLRAAMLLVVRVVDVERCERLGGYDHGPMTSIIQQKTAERVKSRQRTRAAAACKAILEGVVAHIFGQPERLHQLKQCV
jgi:hypothetical protein